MPQQAAVCIFNPHMTFVEAAEFQRAEEDIPDAVIDFLQSNVLAGAADADTDPCVVPADAAVLADEEVLEAAAIRQ